MTYHELQDGYVVTLDAPVAATAAAMQMQFPNSYMNPSHSGTKPIQQAYIYHPHFTQQPYTARSLARSLHVEQKETVNAAPVVARRVSREQHSQIPSLPLPAQHAHSHTQTRSLTHSFSQSLSLSQATSRPNAHSLSQTLSYPQGISEARASTHALSNTQRHGTVHAQGQGQGHPHGQGYGQKHTQLTHARALGHSRSSLSVAKQVYDHPLLPQSAPGSPYPAPIEPTFIGTMTRNVFVKVCTTYLDNGVVLNSSYASMPTHAQPESVFFSVTKPDISTEEYVYRLVHYTQCSPSAFVVMLIYLERIARANGRLRLTAYNLHRLLVTALMLACKVLDDRCFSTLHYAKVGGIPTAREMNRLEMQFLRYLDFRMNVAVETFFTKQHDLNELALAL